MGGIYVLLFPINRGQHFAPVSTYSGVGKGRVLVDYKYGWTVTSNENFWTPEQYSGLFCSLMPSFWMDLLACLLAFSSYRFFQLQFALQINSLGWPCTSYSLLIVYTKAYWCMYSTIWLFSPPPTHPKQLTVLPACPQTKSCFTYFAPTQIIGCFSKAAFPEHFNNMKDATFQLLLKMWAGAHKNSTIQSLFYFSCHWGEKNSYQNQHFQRVQSCMVVSNNFTN